MSDHEKNRGPKNLDQLIEEARGSLKPRQIDWEKVDAQLFARIDAEKPGSETSGVRKSGLPSPLRFAQIKGREPSRTWQVGGLLAIAAAFVFVMHRPAADSDATFDADRAARNGSSSAHAETAVMIGALQPGGDVRVDGEVAVAGRSLRALDAIETTSTHVDLASANGSAAGAVAWRVEDHSRVSIGNLGGGGSPLVVDLASGALEAQVTPVERGEAFAVDLRGDANEVANGSHDVIRIAVHGTHLRVSRVPSRNGQGDKASIDLTEGVVSIGFPPKSGSTYGKLVTAPAHVEIDIARFFAADGADQAVTVDKNPAAVRTPETPTAHDATTSQNTLANEEPAANEAADESHPLAPVPVANSNDQAHATSADHVSSSAIDERATESIRVAAHACAAVRESSNEVRVTVSSKLSLHVGANGIVQMARFEPPLSPAAQDCAGKTIYKTHFAAASSAHDVDIPVNVDP
jgi:hypothetical protein